MTIKSLDDIEREKADRERKKFKEDISEDMGDVFNRIFKTPKKKIKKKKKVWIFLKWLGILFLFLFVITLILGVIWLLKALIQNLFFGG